MKNKYFYFVGFSIFLLLAAPVSGLWLADIIRILFGIHLLLLISKKNRSQLPLIVSEISKKFSRRWVIAYIGLAVSIHLANWTFRYLSLGPLMWDEGQFFQLTHNFAYHDYATITFREQGAYLQRHLSISIFIVSWLYKIFDSGLVVELYQAFFSVLPAAMLAWWVSKKQGDQKDWFLVLLSFLFYFNSPNFISMAHGSYAYHILGLPLLMLAYIAYDFDKTILWTISMALMCFEKEEFAFVALMFALVGFIDSIKQKQYRRTVASVSVIPFIAASIIYLEKNKTDEARELFQNAFGNFGHSASEAVKNLFLHPEIFIKEFFDRPSLGYFIFYVIMSLIWWKPAWNSLKLFLPASILLMLNALAREDGVYNYYQFIGAHYSVMVNLAACVSALFIIVRYLKPTFEATRPLALICLISISFFFSKSSISYELAGNINSTWKNWNDKKLLDQYSEVGSDVHEVLCCDQFCASAASRRWGYFAEDCLKGLSKQDLPHRFILDKKSPFKEKLLQMTSIEKSGDSIDIYQAIPKSQLTKQK